MPWHDCEDCSACCAGPFLIPEVGKAVGQVCPLLGYNSEPKTGGRCQIYTERPERCREFFCLWASDDGEWDLPASLRPDRCGVVFAGAVVRVDGKVQPGAPVAVAHELRDGAVEAYWVDKLIKRLSKQRVVIIRRLDGSQVMMGPPKLVAVMKNYTTIE